MTKPFDLVAYLEKDLEDRRAGGEDCPECGGQGGKRREGHPVYWVDCPDCNGSGKSRYITQAEQALAAARGLVERERKIRETLEPLRRLNETATAGPWLLERPPGEIAGFKAGAVIAATAPGSMIWADPPGGVAPQENRKFIAASRNAIAEVLAIARESEAQGGNGNG